MRSRRVNVKTCPLANAKNPSKKHNSVPVKSSSSRKSKGPKTSPLTNAAPSGPKGNQQTAWALAKIPQLQNVPHDWDVEDEGEWLMGQFGSRDNGTLPKERFLIIHTRNLNNLDTQNRSMLVVHLLKEVKQYEKLTPKQWKSKFDDLEDDEKPPKLVGYFGTVLNKTKLHALEKILGIKQDAYYSSQFRNSVVFSLGKNTTPELAALLNPDRHKFGSGLVITVKDNVSIHNLDEHY